MLVSIDVGYSHVKAMTDGKRVIFPSIVGEWQESHVHLGLAEGEGYEGIEIGDDGKYLFGNTALKQSGMRTRRQDRDWISSTEYRALMLAAISELAKGSVSIQLATGLPIAYFKDRGDLQDLKGIYKISRPGRRSQTVEITDILALPQGLAAVLSEVLDDKGNIENGLIAKGHIGLVDVGGHTTNVATFKKLEEIVRQTHSIDFGTWGVLSEIGKAVNDEFKLSLEDYDVLDAVIKGYVLVFGKREDITHLTAGPLELFANKIIAQSTQTWQDGGRRLDALLIAGGGADLVGPRFEREYPHARIIKDAQWANCRGYLKHARSVWK